MRVAGIMSGTSLDGVDVAVVDIHKSKIETVAHRSTPYPQEIRKAILAVSNTTTTTAAISLLNFQLGEIYAEAVRRAGVPLKTIKLIGCHGQTIFHQGAKPVNTMQIGEAAVIAERTGIPVVSDFRVRDVAAGGQGAPLVPFVDFLLFRHKKKGRIALNLGGIANFTLIPANAKPDEVIAFDTGPGNMVIDALTTELTGGKQLFDRGGAIAAAAHVDRKLLDRLLRDSYYKRKPPKSAGREQYGDEFVAKLRATGLLLPDLIATATALTAATVALGIRQVVKPEMRVSELIVSGGGMHNRQLMGNLAALLPELRIATTNEFGIDGDAKEAIAFAVLAYRTHQGRPGNLPGATGAKHPVVLGKLTP
jgi:anhydro-N-acetylmuramic acid kinase